MVESVRARCPAVRRADRVGDDVGVAGENGHDHPGHEHPGHDHSGQVATFVGVTLAVSAVFWVLGGIREATILLPGLPLSALMFVAPAVGALVALGPATAFRQLGAGVVAGLRHPRRVAWALPWAPLMPAAILVTYPVQAWIGRPLPSFTVDWVTVLVLALAFTVSALVEEVGWTSVLTVRLLRRWRPAAVGLAVGTLWALVHAIPYAQAGNPASWVVWQCLFSIAFRVAMVMAFDLTGGSLSVVVVLHATYNVAWGVYPTQGSHYDPLLATVTTALVAAGLAAVPALRAASTRRPTSIQPPARSGNSTRSS